MRTSKPRHNPNRERFEQLRQCTGLSRDSVYSGIREGKLPGRFIGHKVVITQGEVDAFCAGTWRQPIAEANAPVALPIDSASGTGKIFIDSEGFVWIRLELDQVNELRRLLADERRTTAKRRPN